jgi:hypothetical protein
VKSFLHLLATRGYHEVPSKQPKMQCFNMEICFLMRQAEGYSAW